MEEIGRIEVMQRESDRQLWAVSFTSVAGMQMLQTKNIDHPHARVWPGFSFKSTSLLPGERILGIQYKLVPEEPLKYFDLHFVIAKQK